MAAGDLLGALQFVAGLTGGFAHQTEQIRQQHAKEKLELLSLLAKNDANEIVPIAPGDVPGGQGSFLDRMFGGNAQRTASGDQAFSIGGQTLAVRPRPLMGAGT